MHLELLKKLSFRVTQALAVSLVMVSCVSTKEIRLSASDREAMKGKTFAVTTRRMPEFSVMKASAVAGAALGGAIGGAIAGSMAASEGAGQVAKHRIPNPNKTMSDELGPFLSARTGMKQVPSQHTTDTLDSKEIAAQNTGANYVLDCATTGWMGAYYPFHLGRYYIMFSGRTQLIETSSGRIVSQSFDFYQGDDRDNAPDYDGIYTNDAAFLKAETKKGTYKVAQKFKEQF